MASAPAGINTDFDEESVDYESLLGILKEHLDEEGVEKPFLIDNEGVRIIL